MKLAKILWSFGSILINVTIAIYLYLSGNAPADLEERFAYINDNWGIYAALWKAEFVIMTMITIGAVYFAMHFKKVGWAIVSVGQLILLTSYPLMLGGFRNTSFELASMANQIELVVFVFGNVVFALGLLHVYLTDTILSNWLRNTAATISGIAGFVFLISFLGFIGWRQAMMVGPLVIILYLINAYYGFKLKTE